MDILKRKLKEYIGFLFKNKIKRYPKSIQIIVMYHRIVDKNLVQMHDPHMFIRTDTLQMHINEINKYFKIVDIEEILYAQSENKNMCAITFDDGWIDNFNLAFPILKNNHVPATIFIPVKDIGTMKHFWFEQLFHIANTIQKSNEAQKIFIRQFREFVCRWGPKRLNTKNLLQLIEGLKMMETQMIEDLIEGIYKKLKIEPQKERVLIDWQMVREMELHKISFGSHGLHHDIFTNLKRRVKMDSVIESLAILRDKTVSAAPVFSYPNGNWDHETIGILKDAGYLGAVTTESGLVKNDEPFLLNRIGLTENSSKSPNLLWFQIFKSYYKKKKSVVAG